MAAGLDHLKQRSRWVSTEHRATVVHEEPPGRRNFVTFPNPVLFLICHSACRVREQITFGPGPNMYNCSILKQVRQLIMNTASGQKRLIQVPDYCFTQSLDCCLYRLSNDHREVDEIYFEMNDSWVYLYRAVLFRRSLELVLSPSRCRSRITLLA